MEEVSPAKVPLPKQILNSKVKPINRIILSEDERLVLNRISQMIHTVTIKDTHFASSAKKSRAIILNPKEKYCSGDKLIIQIDMFDYLGNRKTYGGDFILARIFDPTLKAGTSGLVEDFKNGTYYVHFTLFWEGKVYISLLLYHSSEAASALWRARDNDYGLIYFAGTFVNRNKSVKSECGFKLNTVKEVCEYKSIKDHESFYCIKQDNFDCGTLSILQSNNRADTFLRSIEKPLFERENRSIDIQGDFEYINVSTCTAPPVPVLRNCTIGMQYPFPSGYVLQNKWRPVFCNIPNITTQDQMYACMKDKMVYLYGDSTVRQWFDYLANALKGLKTFNLHRPGLSSKLFAADYKKNILMFYKKHSHPYVASNFYFVKDDSYITNDIDGLAGGSDYVVVISLGQHFRPFPIQLFIRRVFNVHKAVERLLLRSPDTKVIIKVENTRELNVDAERFSDFHGYIQTLILKEVFKDLPVGTVDAWDMTIAFNSYSVHPSATVVGSQISMFLSYICS
ncbi:NXPE family member 1-like [Leptodactylus fuscus]|uniref:NXPE family member 1-like n=1 Tax=Leptodactylus fuscus TaxID=238119 RepID=UPI003F4E7E55